MKLRGISDGVIYRQMIKSWEHRDRYRSESQSLNGNRQKAGVEATAFCCLMGLCVMVRGKNSNKKGKEDGEMK